MKTLTEKRTYQQNYMKMWREKNRVKWRSIVRKAFKQYYKNNREYRLPSFDRDSFKRTVQSQLDQLVSKENTKIDLSTGPFDTTIVVPVVIPTARDLFSQDLALLRNFQNAAALGVIDANDSAYVSQLDKVKKGFDPLFIDLF